MVFATREWMDRASMNVDGDGAQISSGIDPRYAQRSGSAGCASRVAFVIDPRGRVTSLEAPAALQRLGWLGAGPPLRGHVRPMGMIAAPATGGDVVVTTSAARRPSAAARACDR